MSNSVTITPEGAVNFIWSDDLADMLEIGAGKIARASHVEPNEEGQWEADLSPVGGPKLGPFRLRNEALTAEVEWLKANGY